MNRPTRMDFVAFCRAMPQIAVQFRRMIPSSFWIVDGDVAEVSCPCGHTPRIEHMIPHECDCDRFFLYDGQNVRVARYDTADAVQSERQT